jgi:hypothetical protein
MPYSIINPCWAWSGCCGLRFASAFPSASGETGRASPAHPLGLPDGILQNKTVDYLEEIAESEVNHNAS